MFTRIQKTFVNRKTDKLNIKHMDITTEKILLKKIDELVNAINTLKSIVKDQQDEIDSLKNEIRNMLYD